MSIEAYPSPNGVLTSLIWRKTAVGGETSLSGYDNASQALSYTPGQEQVYLNGILLVRGADYTATNGTSISSLTALAADDFVQVNCYNNFSVASVPAASISGTISNSQLTSSSTSTAGIVQLTDSTSSTSTTTAATPNAVKSAYDLANGAIPKTLTTTTGDIIYASGANTPARLGIGTTGQVLTVAGGVPSWATPAGGGGKVLQVVNATVSTQASTTSTSFQDTGLTATITPTSSSSKVLVMLLQNGVAKVNDGGVRLKLFRGATDLGQFQASAAYTNSTAWSDVGSVGFNYLDTPATTSATTYKTQFRSGSSSATAYVQLIGANTADMATSSIVLMEIGA